MTTHTQNAGDDAPKPEAAVARVIRGTGEAGWALPTYLVGLGLIYIGERVVSADGMNRWALTVAGVTAAVTAASARVVSSFGAGSQSRRRIERWLGVLSWLGLGAVGLYFIGEYRLIPGAREGAGGIEYAQRLEGLWIVVWSILLGAAVVPLIFGETALGPMRRSARPELGRVRTALSAGAVLAFAAAYCGLAVYAVGDQNWKVDYSYFKTSRPGESTQKIVRSLNEPVTAYAFFPAVNEVKSETMSYLNELSKLSGGKLRVETHDRLLTPKLARQYRVSRDGTVVLVKGEGDVSFNVGSEMEDAKANLKILDETVQKNLLRIARSSRIAYLTVGHGELNDRAGGRQGEENSAGIAKQVLDALGYRARDLGLNEGLGREVPEDATVVLVLGPSEPFAPEELATLERYAARGGKLLLALDPGRTASRTGLVSAGSDENTPKDESVATTPASPAAPAPAASASASPSAALPAVSSETRVAPPTPSLAQNPFLESLQRLAAIGRVELGAALLASMDNHLQRRFDASDRVLLVTNVFSSHAAVSTLSRNVSRQAAVGIFGSGSLRPLANAPGPRPDFSIRTAEDVFSDEDGDLNKGSNESLGTHNVAAAFSQPLAGAKAAPKESTKGEKGKSDSAAPGGPTDETRVFVIADVDGFSDFVLARAAGQQILLADVIRWLGGEESFSGAVSTEKDVPIEHTRQGDMLWFYSTIFGAPAVVLAVGRVFRGRRRRGGKR